jgi:hypothetical protein
MFLSPPSSLLFPLPSILHCRCHFELGFIAIEKRESRAETRRYWRVESRLRGSWAHDLSAVKSPESR